MPAAALLRFPDSVAAAEEAAFVAGFGAEAVVACEPHRFDAGAATTSHALEEVVVAARFTAPDRAAARASAESLAEAAARRVPPVAASVLDDDDVAVEDVQASRYLAVTVPLTNLGSLIRDIDALARADQARVVIRGDLLKPSFALTFSGHATARSRALRATVRAAARWRSKYRASVTLAASFPEQPGDDAAAARVRRSRGARTYALAAAFITGLAGGYAYRRQRRER